MPSELTFVAEFVAGRLVNGAAAGLLIVVLAWSLLRLGRKQDSGTRFAVWFAALIAMALLTLVGPGPAQGHGGSLAAGQALIVMPGAWAVGVFAVWLLASGLALARVAAGIAQLRRLRKSSRPVSDPALESAFRELARAGCPTRNVDLRVSDYVQVPTAIGFLKPTVLIPGWALQDLSASQLDSVLLHELAHLRRWDDWTNLAQKLLRAILYFHPAVWWVDGKLSLEREMACDDLVLARTDNPHSYAQCLVALAEKSYIRRGLALAQAAVHRAGQTRLRLVQILDKNRPPAARAWRPMAGLAATLPLFFLISYSQIPALLTFGDYASTLAPTPRSLLGIGPSSSSLVSGARAQASEEIAGEKATRRPSQQALAVRAAGAAGLGPGQEPRPAITTALKEQSPIPPAVESRSVDPAAEILVVVEKRQFGDVAGQTFWSIQVFHFAVFKPAASQPAGESPRKSI